MNHTTALAAYFLAPPKPSPTATSLGEQWHYALSSWTPGGFGILVGILALLIFLTVVVRRHGSSSQQ